MVQKQKGILARLNAERSAMPVMMPGSAMGRMTRSEIVSRPKNRSRDTAAAHSVPRTMAISVEIAATRSDRQRLPDVGPVPGRPRTIQRQARRRPLVAPLLGGEGVDEDQQERHVQEQQARRRQRSSGQRHAGRVRAHRTPPCRWRTTDRSP